MTEEKKNIYSAFQITRSRLYEQITEQIQELVISGKLRPGDRMPSERELAEQLGVSRPTIREVLRVLRERGLVELRPGSGTYVTAVHPDSVSRSLERLFFSEDAPYHELQQIREILEPEVAALCAQNREPEDIQAIENALARMEAANTALEPYSDADVEFHMGLVQGTHNGMLYALFKPIVGMLRDVIRESRAEGLAQSGDERRRIDAAIADFLQQHRDILETVKNGAPERARQAMRGHLAHAGVYVDLVIQRRRAGRIADRQIEGALLKSDS